MTESGPFGYIMKILWVVEGLKILGNCHGFEGIFLEREILHFGSALFLIPWGLFVWVLKV